MSRVKHSHLNVLNVLNDFQVSTSSVFTERDVVHFRVGTALCPRDLNFGLPGKKKDVDCEARFLGEDGWRGVWGFGGIVP